jgi:hypothetical protein
MMSKQVGSIHSTKLHTRRRKSCLRRFGSCLVVHFEEAEATVLGRPTLVLMSCDIQLFYATHQLPKSFQKLLAVFVARDVADVDLVPLFA